MTKKLNDILAAETKETQRDIFKISKLGKEIHNKKIEILELQEEILKLEEEKNSIQTVKDMRIDKFHQYILKEF